MTDYVFVDSETIIIYSDLSLSSEFPDGCKLKG